MRKGQPGRQPAADRSPTRPPAPEAEGNTADEEDDEDLERVLDEAAAEAKDLFVDADVKHRHNVPATMAALLGKQTAVAPAVGGDLRRR